MLKVLFLFLAVFSSCAGAPPGPEPTVEAPDEPAPRGDSGAGYFVSGPRAGTLVVIGVSGRMRNAEQEIERALDDATLQVALYHGLRGKTLTVLETGAGYRSFYLSLQSELAPLDEGADYREALRFGEQDLVRTEGAVFLRCVYDAPGLPPLEYDYGIEDGKPAWLHGGLAEIPGYISAVGFAKNHRYLNDTVRKSRENAAAALLTALSSRIDVTDYVNRGAALSAVELVEGELFSFMTLEIWIDPASGSVWTLAAAKKIQ
jgi:hypothetical protein